MVTLKDVRDDLNEALKLLKDGPVRWENCVKASTFLIKSVGDLQDIEAALQETVADTKKALT